MQPIRQPHLHARVELRATEPAMVSPRRLRADFNGLFGDVLCLSHTDECVDEAGSVVHLHPGMSATAFEKDVDEHGRADELVASGVVEAAPPWLSCNGSRSVLRIDSRGVRHASEERSENP